MKKLEIGLKINLTLLKWIKIDLNNYKTKINKILMINKIIIINYKILSNLFLININREKSKNNKFHYNLGKRVKTLNWTRTST